MKRYQQVLGWLNHDERPAEKQSPVMAATGVALLSFILLALFEHRAVAMLQTSWVRLACYACLPAMLTFITLYRSAWHEHTQATVRALLAAAYSLLIVLGVGLALLLAVILGYVLIVAYGGLARFHY